MSVSLQEQVKFQITDHNYIGVPEGVLYAPQGTKLEELIGWRTFSYGLSNWENDPVVNPDDEKFEVIASDIAVYHNDVCLAINCNGSWYSPSEVPEN
jgi:hypothetical protein